LEEKPGNSSLSGSVGGSPGGGYVEVEAPFAEATEDEESFYRKDRKGIRKERDKSSLSVGLEQEEE
jgi:hypothetical protein